MPNMIGITAGCISGGQGGGTTTPAVPAQTLFDHSTVTVAGANEPATTLTCGVVFNSTVPGEIRAISFYKSSADSAVGRAVGLYSSTGTAVASGTSTGEAAGPGWISVNLSSPYIIASGVSYVAGVFYPNGNYPFESNTFSSAVVRGDLVAESDIAAPNNGRYKYGAALAYPDSAGHGSFGIDVDFYPS